MGNEAYQHGGFPDEAGNECSSAHNVRHETTFACEQSLIEQGLMAPAL
jgi:hypothetical protein